MTLKQFIKLIFQAGTLHYDIGTIRTGEGKLIITPIKNRGKQ